MIIKINSIFSIIMMNFFTISQTSFKRKKKKIQLHFYIVQTDVSKQFLN